MRVLMIAGVSAVLLLSGCVAVPYGTVAGPEPYYYAPPAASFHFGYTYRDRGHPGWRHGHTHGHRHRHRH